MNRLVIIKRFFLDIFPTTKTLVEPMMKYFIVIEVSKEINRSITDFGEKIENSKKELQRSALYFFEGLLILVATLTVLINIQPNEISLGQKLTSNVLGVESGALFFLFIVISWPYAAHYVSCFIKNKSSLPFASISTAMYWWGFIFSIVTFLLVLFVPISYAFKGDIELIKTEPYNYIAVLIGVAYAFIIYIFLIRHIFNFPIWFLVVNELRIFSLCISLFVGFLLSYFLLIPLVIVSQIVSTIFQFL